MSRKSACYPRWMVVLIGLSLFAGPALGQVYQYRAQLRAAAIQQGQVSASGIVWNCAGSVCRTSGPWPTPGLGACQTLAAKVGAVSSYGHPGAGLSSGQLSQCNQGLASPLLASPQLAVPMTKLAPMATIKPTLQTKSVPLPAGTVAKLTPAQLQQRTTMFNQLSKQRAQAVLQAAKPIPMLDAGDAGMRAAAAAAGATMTEGCPNGDSDGDGHDAITCGGDDCDDNDANRFPGKAEICDSNGHDEDCDVTTYGQRDADADGFGDARCMNAFGGERKSGNDCDDNLHNVNPDAADICDRLDNNCDGIVDLNQTLTFFLDADGDGHGSPDNRVDACPYDQSAAAATGRWLVMVGNDCDDSNPDLWHDCP